MQPENHDRCNTVHPDLYFRRAEEEFRGTRARLALSRRQSIAPRMQRDFAFLRRYASLLWRSRGQISLCSTQSVHWRSHKCYAQQQNTSPGINGFRQPGIRKIFMRF